MLEAKARGAKVMAILWLKRGHAGVAGDNSTLVNAGC